MDSKLYKWIVDNKDEKELILGEGFTAILDKDYLWYCRGLERVVIGKQVTTIEDRAFSGCSNLKDVELDPENEHFSIVEDCLIRNSDGRMLHCMGVPKIPDCVTAVDVDDVFHYNGSLEEFYIGASVRDLGKIRKGFNVERFVISPQNQWFEERGGCLFKKGETKLLIGCDSVEEIPDGTEIIGGGAFHCAKVNRIVIPESVKVIEKDAFCFCPSLKEVDFSEGLERIEQSAFFRCEALSDLCLPDSLVFIGEEAFYSCEGLKTITSFGGVSELSEKAFIFCSSLEEVTIPGNIRSLAREVFYSCKGLKRVEFRNGIKEIGHGAFSTCTGLETVIMSDSIVKLDVDSFEGCSALKEIRFSNALTEIPIMCFARCTSLKEVVLPPSIKYLKSGAFYDCSSLTKINLDCVKRFPKDAFSNCRRLPKEIKNPPKPVRRALPNQLLYWKENYKEGESLTLMRIGTYSDLPAKYYGTVTYRAEEYVYAKQKDQEFFIRLSDRMDKFYESCCEAEAIGEGDPLFKELKEALSSTTLI